MAQPLSFQDLIARLQEYWRKQGCLDWLPYHETVGAGTCNPATVLRVLGPEPWNVAYVEPSFRPDDGRFGENPNRVQMHHQFQVIMQPAPADPIGVYLGSLEAIGLNLADHDIRFVEDNWESPALGAWGLGWEVWLDGMEVTQFTYFQQAGGIVLESPAVEYTYGLERIGLYLQNKSSIWDLSWDGKQSYGEILKQQEIEFCEYDFNVAEIERLKTLWAVYSAEAKLCLEKGLVIPAHDYVLKCSHTFNLLDTRGAVGLAERVKFFGEMRGLARKVSESFLKQRESLGFPLTKYIPEWKAPEAGLLPKPSSKRESFLFELGTEELAASVPETLLTQLREGLVKLLAESRLSHGEVSAFASPRRLSVLISEVEPGQKDMTMNVRGPRKDVCEKNPKALEGFCRKNGIEPSQVKYESVDGVEYAAASIEVKGKSAAEVLSEKLPGVIAGLRAHQNMRWLAVPQAGEQAAAVNFNRPIRWLVALLGAEVVPFVYASVASGRTSRGGRWEGSPEIAIATADAYAGALQSHGIILNHEERKKVIRAQAEKAAAEIGGTAQIRESVLDEVTQLVEFPTAFAGKFAEEYRKLPNVVLAGTMEKHLRCFPVLDKSGAIFAFIGVRNGGTQSLDVVRAGYERVIGARFSDAAFFVSRDETKKIEQFRERIKTLTFVEGLGSMYDKTERLKTLAAEVSKALPAFKANPSEVERAAALSKADLGSQMVIEMSALQGKMGRLYAERSGEPAAVAVALQELYQPGFAGDSLPDSATGTILSLADKFDTIAALFSIGAEPTGSADPYGIRREAIGILSILLGKNLSISLRNLFGRSLQLLNAKDREATLGRVMEFVRKRLEVILRERGHRYDVVRAVLAKTDDDPATAEALVRELEQILANRENDAAITAYLRCLRIIDHAKEKGVTVSKPVSADVMSDAAEKELWAKFSELNGAGKGLSGAFGKVSKLVVPINTFFDTVMVMANDAAVRENRLAVVWAIVSLVERYADLSALEAAAKQ